jgi:hypothetical protein
VWSKCPKETVNNVDFFCVYIGGAREPFCSGLNKNTKRKKERKKEREMRNNQVRLNCGITMPVIGLGTYSSQNDRETTELAIHTALKVQTVH